jgi:hypothetical protein
MGEEHIPVRMRINDQFGHVGLIPIAFTPLPNKDENFRLNLHTHKNLLNTCQPIMFT